MHLLVKRNFDLIKMHGTTIKKHTDNFLLGHDAVWYDTHTYIYIYIYGSLRGMYYFSQPGKGLLSQSSFCETEMSPIMDSLLK